MKKLLQTTAFIARSNEDENQETTARIMPEEDGGGIWMDEAYFGDAAHLGNHIKGLLMLAEALGWKMGKVEVNDTA